MGELTNHKGTHTRHFQAHIVGRDFRRPSRQKAHKLVKTLVKVMVGKGGYLQVDASERQSARHLCTTLADGRGGANVATMTHHDDLFCPGFQSSTRLQSTSETRVV